MKPKAGKQFTKASQEALAEAIKQAKALVEDPNATQEAVDKCLSILSQAIEAMAEEPISSNSTGNNGNHSTVSGTGGVTSQGKGTATGGTTTKPPLLVLCQKQMKLFRQSGQSVVFY